MEQLNKRTIEQSVPRHVVLFPDGNRRWARERGLDTLEGHKVGYEKLLALARWCQKRRVEALTAFGFSTENWNRSPREVAYLMELLENALRDNFSEEATTQEAQELGVRVRVIGQLERLPLSLQKIISEVEEYTNHNTRLFLTFAVSYGGKWDIVQAVRKLVAKGAAPQEITEETIEEHLATAGLPKPDLVIRPGGEQRLSNFVVWQAAYAELYFSKKYWPEFEERDFEEALAEYGRRQRRFGH